MTWQEILKEAREAAEREAGAQKAVTPDPAMEIPADLKQRVAEMMAGRVEREDKTINELLPLLHRAAQWIEDHCQGDTKQINAIQKRLRIEFAEFRSIKIAQDATDEQRAKLLGFAGSDSLLDLCDILVEIKQVKKGAD